MASKETVPMLAALADDERIRIIEVLAECDRTDAKLSEMLSIGVERIRKQAAVLEKAGLISSCEDDDEIDYIIDPKQIAVLTGFFELVLNKCSPRKCC